MRMLTFLDALRKKLAGVARRLRAFSLRLGGRTTPVRTTDSEAAPKPAAPLVSPQAAPAEASPTRSGGDDESPRASSPDGTPTLTADANAGAVPDTTSDNGGPPSDAPAYAGDHVVAEDQGPGGERSERFRAEAAAEPQVPAARDRPGPDEQTGAAKNESVTADGDAEKSPAFAARREIEVSGEEQPPGGGHVPYDSGEISAHSQEVIAPEAAPDADAAPASESEREPSQLALGRATADRPTDGGTRQGSRPGGDEQQDASTAFAMEALPRAGHVVDETADPPHDADTVLSGYDKTDLGRMARADKGTLAIPQADVPRSLKDVRDAVAAVPAPARRTVDQRRGRIDPEELGRAALVTAPALDDVNYLVWNRALAEHCLLGDEVDDVLYLTVTPTILAAALSNVQPGRLLPEDAEAAFVGSVAAVYRGRVLGHRQRLQILRRCGADGIPECIAFLAASVLAAYQMRSDEETAATAYYSRLAELLGCDLSGGHPRGFDPDEFEALWHFLNAWLRAEKGRRLALPAPDVGLRRFVALPLTHVPLRRVDIERLPEFFTWAGYEPGARKTRTKLDQDLVSWSLGRTPFTSAGMAALADERRAAVLAQIAHELESWDGAHTDSLGRRSGRVEILLDVVQRRPELFYLPRRPAAFPQVFDDGARAFEASDEGWYDPVPLGSEDGQALSEGFEWQVIAGRLRLVLHRPGACAIALPASHEYTGYLSQRALQLGAPAAALCRETLAQPASEYLSKISQQRCVPINHPGLPEGWRLFTGIRPQRKGEIPPAGLEALAVEAAVDLIPTGGLRLGGRWAWVVGAPPRLIVAGLEVGERVTIDGEPVAIAGDGTLAGNGALARPGTHIIEAAGLRRRVEITEPQVQGQPWTPPPPRTVLALPRGSWTLIGAVPGVVDVPMLRSPTGSVASCSFPVVWAIEVAGGPGARVLCISLPPPPPRRVARFAPRGPSGGGLAWASTIYNAAIRRPRMATLDGQPCQPDDRAVWAEYARAAREIKRQFRRARR